MPNITLMEINDAIATTLAGATGISTSQSYDELKEGIPPGDMPLLQVYPETIDCDVDVGTERTTFQGGVRTKTIVFHADLYARQRSNIADDMSEATEIASNIVDELERHNIKPYFDLDGIKAFDWRGERVVFTYTDNVQYMGWRFYITITIF